MYAYAQLVADGAVEGGVAVDAVAYGTIVAVAEDTSVLVSLVSHRLVSEGKAFEDALRCAFPILSATHAYDR